MCTDFMGHCKVIQNKHTVRIDGQQLANSACLTSTQKQLTFVNNRETHSSPILRPLDLSSGSQKRCSATSLAASASCSICDCFWDQIMACYIWEKCCIGQLTCRDW